MSRGRDNKQRKPPRRQGDQARQPNRQQPGAVERVLAALLGGKRQEGRDNK